MGRGHELFEHFLALAIRVLPLIVVLVAQLEGGYTVRRDLNEEVKLIGE